MAVDPVITQCRAVRTVPVLLCLNTNPKQENAMDHGLGYGVLIDVTARDIQARAKKAGKPGVAP